MMKRLLILLLWSLALIAPVRAASLVNVPITTAVTAQVGPTLQVRNTVGSGWPTSLSVSWNFTYGSGGTTVNAWLQTSLDGGTTWCDVATAALTTSSLHQVQNLTSNTVTPLAACADGSGSGIAVFGSQWRVKYSSSGTYAGTTLRIDMIGNGLTAFP